MRSLSVAHVALVVMLSTLSVASAACSSKCTTGATQACACLGGLTGVQTCGAEGALGACECGQLSETRARDLALAQPDFVDGVQCEVLLTAVAHERYAIDSYDDTKRACLGGLESAGVVLKGQCTNEYCNAMEVSTTAKSRMRGNWLTFRCGSVRMLGVSGITTTGNQATFSYEREVTPDSAIIQRVASCQLRVAEPGRATRRRTARRDDAGHWTLVTE